MMHLQNSLTVRTYTQAKAGGDTSGANLRTASYVPTLLNQYTNRTVPGYLPVTGSAHSNAVVTVNGTAAGRQGEYFWRELAVNNGSSPVWQGITNVGVLNQSNNPSIRTIDTGNLFLPQSPETYNHDADGNLLSDGHWNYTWDVENRLVKMETVAAAYAAGAPRQAIVFVYDDQSRRIQKVVSNYVAGAWSLTSDQRFVYDGWNLLAVLTSDLGLLTSFTWGLDLSGTPQGAGGVGGLLSVYDSTTINNQASTHFPCFDGNGNVMALVNAVDGSLSAQYEYGPFGELIRATGPMARANPLRFSTKFQDNESDLLYYGYRSYNPHTGRWLSRDPIEEAGFDPVRANQEALRDTKIAEDRRQIVRHLQNGQLSVMINWLADFENEQSLAGGNLEGRLHEELNLYAYVHNEPIEHLDGLRGMTLSYACPSYRWCATCVITFEPSGKQLFYLAVNAKKFISCATRSAGIMNLGCALASRTFFNKGCDALGGCLQLYTRQIWPTGP